MSQQIFFENKQFKWINLQNPTKQELDKIAVTYSFQKLTIEDSLEPGHLPKYESDESTSSFLLVRFFDKEHRTLKNTVREFSHKISIYLGPNYIITVHQKETDIFDLIQRKYLSKLDPEKVTSKGILYRIISETIKTYEEPANKMDEEVDQLEHLIFTGDLRKIKIPTLYKIKREATACKKILDYTLEALKEYRLDNKRTSSSQDLYEENVKMLHLHSQIVDDVQNLLSVYLSMNGQKSNEIMQTLTIFSAFFLPLTFIAGIYGMNFDFMPELAYKWSYPICLLVMLIVVFFIYFWFKKKKYL
ncbi:magnesium transporter [Chishuiella changwenlii]|uniref:Magnesium transport protein CorA n=1 Tax=Chishuiella changwenlii TaxID=1434701 RepID=A0A1M6ZDU9_9FLAO|nr:CorA family divalent cation transporter [Chishuiella changwenlii]GGE86316.1 magnesium transport protein CorA [Chishuiella changwenlii]SHL28672.1 magnesium transporter [Chishuiella changwenlii]